MEKYKCSWVRPGIAGGARYDGIETIEAEDAEEAIRLTKAIVRKKMEFTYMSEIKVIVVKEK